MGKGSGKGSGKGGCEVCVDGVVGMLVCGLIILLLGPILIGVGIAMFVSAGKNDRQHNIDTVNSAVSSWQGSGPNNQNSFNGQTTFRLSVSPALLSTQCTSNTQFYFTQTFTVNNQQTEYFADDPSNWKSVKQSALTTQLATNLQGGCGWRMDISYSVTNSGGPWTNLTSYTLLSPVVQNVQLNPVSGSNYCPGQGNSLGSCSSSSAKGCQNNCAAMGGVWSCSGSLDFSCLAPASITQVCFKIKSNGTVNQWALDPTFPNRNQGCSVLPQSVLRSTSQGNIVFGNELFAVPNATITSVPQTSINVVIRNSAEPWLAYMEATGGTGQLGAEKKALIITGIILVIIGAIVSLIWFVAIYCCIKVCCCGGMGNQRPQGAVDGRAWDVANRFGYVTPGYPAGVPMGTPMYPAAGGNPNYTYPTQQPYAYPPQGATYGAPYAAPAPGAQPYAYPPPPPGGPAYAPPPVQGNWQQQAPPPTYPTVSKV